MVTGLIRVLNETSGCSRIESAYSYDLDDHCCPIPLPLKVQNKSATALAAHSIGSSCTGGQAQQSAPQVERRRIIENSLLSSNDRMIGRYRALTSAGDGRALDTILAECTNTLTLACHTDVTLQQQVR